MTKRRVRTHSEEEDVSLPSHKSRRIPIPVRSRARSVSEEPDEASRMRTLPEKTVLTDSSALKIFNSILRKKRDGNFGP